MAFDYLGGLELELPDKLHGVFLSAIKKYERAAKKVVGNFLRAVGMRRRLSSVLIGEESSMVATALELINSVRNVASNLAVKSKE
jgi:hypothetical protein